MEILHPQVSQNHMATTFRFSVSCDKLREIAAFSTLEDAHKLVQQLESELSEFNEKSPIAILNRSEPGEKVAFTEHGFFLLMQSMALSARTEGAFSAMAKTVGGIANASVEWDESTQEVWRTNRNTHISFGAIGKGYALDQVRAELERNGFFDYLLSAGGSSQVLSGFAFPDTPWSWGWALTKKEGEWQGVEFKHNQGTPISIGVSGTQEQGAHLIDPRDNSQPTKLYSALVAGESATEADALSTALFVSGWEKREQLGNELRELPALGVYQPNGEARWNETFEYLWGPVCHA